MPYAMLLLIFLSSAFFNPCLASEGIIPKAAAKISEEIHEQLSSRVNHGEKISIIITTPALLSDLTKTNALAKQFAEDLMHYFVKLGYRVQELRKGEEIRVNLNTGELILTRDQKQLARSAITSEAILAGTYTVTNKTVRFNIRALHTPTNEVLAMASASIPVTKEMLPLLKTSEETIYQPNQPSVRTRFN